MFEVFVMYYRPPMPPEEFWEEDLKAIRDAGFSMIRIWALWPWLEPEPGIYELEDIDKLFEVASRNNLRVNFGFTHSWSVPRWMIREYPDMRPVLNNGEIVEPHFRASTPPMGGSFPCFDHPKWRVQSEKLLRTIVTRYKDVPNLAMWDVWDEPRMPVHAPFNRSGLACYCTHTVARYKDWLVKNFSIPQINRMWHTRYRCWEDIEPPRSVEDISGMLLWRRFLRENLTDHLKWTVDLLKSIDNIHPAHTHKPGQGPDRHNEIMVDCCSDERNAEILDSYGVNLPTAPSFFAGADPYEIYANFLALDWVRSISSEFWVDELFAGQAPRGMSYARQAEPEDIVLNLWMALASGAKGVGLWQYRPEYKTFEAPGYSLVAPDGSATKRLSVTAETIGHLNSISEHLPIHTPNAEVAILYDEESSVMFSLGSRGSRRSHLKTPYSDGLYGVYRALWESNIPVDFVTLSMDWRAYKVVWLPNLVVLNQCLIEKISRIVENMSHNTHLVADGLFGLYNAFGRFSYRPPEGLSDLFGVKAVDFSLLTEKDLQEGPSSLNTIFGKAEMVPGFRYAELQPFGKTKVIATLGSRVMGVQTCNEEFTWFSFSLGEKAINDMQRLIFNVTNSFGIEQPVKTRGSKIIVRRTRSNLGGWLLFLFNLEPKQADIVVEPLWPFSSSKDLLLDEVLPIEDGRFTVRVKPGKAGVIYCS